MHYTTLPRTDMKVSTIAMGCWPLAGDSTWGPQDEQTSIEAVRAALDAGINFFDTAEIYGDGLSEQRLGRALGDRRDKAIIATKVLSQNLRPDDLAAACERSLANLGTDYIDLYQIHWPARDIPLADTWPALQKLREQGKIRATGVSNFGIGDLGDLLPIGTPVTNQLPYSLLTRSIEHDIIPLCRQHEIGLLCYSPLMWGILTGKYADADEVPAGRARSRHFSSARPQTRHGEAGCEDLTFEAIGKLRQLSEQLNISMADLAIAWVLHQPGVSSVLAGIRKPSQAHRNAAAADVKLDAGVIQELNDLSQPVKDALGPDPDLWETAASSRYR